MDDLLLIVVLGIPVLTLIVGRIFFNDIPERHHREYDTYTIPRVLPGTLLVVMIFMSVLAVMVWWLCHLGVFHNNTWLVLSFFSSFLVTLLLVWVCISRYQVVTFADHLVARQLLGNVREVRYSDIERMLLTPMRVGGSYNNLTIYLREGRRLVIWGALDVEQMLLRIDRFDALEA